MSRSFVDEILTCSVLLGSREDGSEAPSVFSRSLRHLSLPCQFDALPISLSEAERKQRVVDNLFRNLAIIPPKPPKTDRTAENVLYIDLESYTALAASAFKPAEVVCNEPVEARAFKKALEAFFDCNEEALFLDTLHRHWRTFALRLSEDTFALLGERVSDSAAIEILKFLKVVPVVGRDALRLGASSFFEHTSRRKHFRSFQMAVEQEQQFKKIPCLARCTVEKDLRECLNFIDHQHFQLVRDCSSSPESVLRNADILLFRAAVLRDMRFFLDVLDSSISEKADAGALKKTLLKVFEVAILNGCLELAEFLRCSVQLLTGEKFSLNLQTALQPLELLQSARGYMNASVANPISLSYLQGISFQSPFQSLRRLRRPFEADIRALQIPATEKNHEWTLWQNSCRQLLLDEVSNFFASIPEIPAFQNLKPLQQFCATMPDPKTGLKQLALVAENKSFLLATRAGFDLTAADFRKFVTASSKTRMHSSRL